MAIGTPVTHRYILVRTVVSYTPRKMQYPAPFWGSIVLEVSAQPSAHPTFILSPLNKLLRQNSHHMKSAILQATIQWHLTTFLMLCNHHSCLVPRHFHHSSNKAIKHFLLTHRRPRGHQAAFCLSAFISSGHFLQMELCNSTYGMSISVIFLKFSCVVSPSFLFTGERILLCPSLCVYLCMPLSIAICSAIHPLVSIWVVATFWLLLTALLWTVRDIHLFKYMF